jgi:hypothetical protein
MSPAIKHTYPFGASWICGAWAVPESSRLRSHAYTSPAVPVGQVPLFANACEAGLHRAPVRTASRPGMPLALPLSPQAHKTGRSSCRAAFAGPVGQTARLRPLRKSQAPAHGAVQPEKAVAATQRRKGAKTQGFGFPGSNARLAVYQSKQSSLTTENADNPKRHRRLSKRARSPCG